MDRLLQIIGFGPAALGLFIAADRERQLPALLSLGIDVHERSPSVAQWDCLAYDIQANSPIQDFLQGIRPDGAFAECLRQSEVRDWLQDPSRILQLESISAFLRQLAQVVIAVCADHPATSVTFGRRVDAVQASDSGFICQGNWGRSFSRYLVLACGARGRPLQLTCADLRQTVERHWPTPLCSDGVLRGQADAQLRDAVGQGRQILVLGGSHSAFSTVEYLLRRLGSELAPRSLHVLCRKRPGLWQVPGTPASQLLPDDVVDTVSGEVNRFRGLRGKARQTLLEVESGRQPAVVLHVGEPDLEPWRLAAPLLINATGYEPRMPELRDSLGQPMALDTWQDNHRKHPLTHELTSNGQPIRGLFGTGLGFADQQGATIEVGVNFFHGRCANNILKAVL
ncbi:hypothetical protein [Pseudomonas sp. CCOS 191]|uniref:hypothetical protein n=1 Tax=Pseudomonas sp. CCOS 191 TaxID=1649877 RepID=UPI00062461DD|nr:hypothetical protein [Pseudomonas sp. CCOS 191]CRI58557.1 hypothetical protein CCOS191_4021 [Pseudomonas sp. CCOS 191]